jgi:hypothetical protein
MVRLRLEPSAGPVGCCPVHCGTARTAYNTLLLQVRANLGQRAAHKTYDITGADLTPARSWHRFDPGEAAPGEPGAVAARGTNRSRTWCWTGPRTTSRPRRPGGRPVRPAAKLIRDGRGHVQEVTYSLRGGHWWASLRMRVLPPAVTQPTGARMQPRAASVGGGERHGGTRAYRAWQRHELCRVNPHELPFWRNVHTPED